MDIKNEAEVKEAVDSIMKNGLKVDKNTADLLDIMLQLIDSTIEIQKDSVFIIRYLVITLQSIIYAINFIFSILFWFLFLRNPFGEVVYKILPMWGSLSEGWQIAIFALIGSIPAAVVAGVILIFIDRFWLNKFIGSAQYPHAFPELLKALLQPSKKR